MQVKWVWGRILATDASKIGLAPKRGLQGNWGDVVWGKNRTLLHKSSDNQRGAEHFRSTTSSWSRDPDYCRRIFGYLVRQLQTGDIGLPVKQVSCMIKIFRDIKETSMVWPLFSVLPSPLWAYLNRATPAKSEPYDWIIRYLPHVCFSAMSVEQATLNLKFKSSDKVRRVPIFQLLSRDMTLQRI